VIIIIIIIIIITEQAPSKTQLDHQTQSTVRWSETVCHRNWSTKLIKAPHYDGKDAQKLAVHITRT